MCCDHTIQETDVAATASIVEIIVMAVLLAALPCWCLWQKDVKTRHLGMVAIIGGVLGFTLTIAEEVRWQVEYARSQWVRIPEERSLLDEILSVLERNDLSWRAYLSFAALGMLASVLSLLILGPY